MGAPKRRPFAYVLHSVLGVKLSLFMAFVCLTGSIATVAHEIEWLYKPAVRASAAGDPAEWGAMWDAAREAFPEASLQAISSYDRSDSAYFAKSVAAADSQGRDFTIYVDPGRGQVTGHEYGRSFQDAIRALHYYLFLPGSIPFYLVSSLGVVLLASLISGLVVYKKFWRGFLRRPQWHRGQRALMGDLHRLGALWSLWFVLLISLTAIWYLVEHAGVDLETPTPQASPRPADLPARGIDIQRWVNLARDTQPGLQVTAVSLPWGEGEPIIVQGQWRAWLVRERTNAIYIDPLSEQVIGQRVAHQLSVGERLVHTADPLHFGTFGGLFTRLLWFLFGLVLTGLSITGALIHIRRLRELPGSGPLSSLNYLGGWKWPSLVLVSLAPAIGFAFW